MKKLRKLIAIFLLLILYSYVVNITNFPNTIITYNEESISNYKLCPFLKLSGTTSVSSSTDGENQYNLSLNFGNVTVKQVDLTVLEETKLVPVGKLTGIKLYIDGVMIVGFSEVENINGEMESISDTSDLEEGDRIISINRIPIENIEDLQNAINLSYGETLEIEVENIDGESKKVTLNPIQTGEDEYKLGLWVKEGATGCGTISFYNPETNEFVALGHGIVDSDTEELIQIDTGEITTTQVLSLTKGVSGNPGEIRGTVTDEVIGTITKNTEFGLYGIVDDLESLGIDDNEAVEVALRDEIETGEATIICSLDGKTTKEYSIEITRIFINNNENNKSFMIKVTDEELINETGGIIRGLSGSPIMQNGKIIGCVTNVLVSDSKIGYGVFADLLVQGLDKNE